MTNKTKQERTETAELVYATKDGGIHLLNPNNPRSSRNDLLIAQRKNVEPTSITSIEKDVAEQIRRKRK